MRVCVKAIGDQVEGTWQNINPALARVCETNEDWVKATRLNTIPTNIDATVFNIIDFDATNNIYTTNSWLVPIFFCLGSADISFNNDILNLRYLHLLTQT